jgi:hypothetical protein
MGDVSLSLKPRGKPRQTKAKRGRIERSRRSFGNQGRKIAHDQNMILSSGPPNPKFVLVMGVVALAVFGHALFKGLRTGRFPRVRPRFGKLPPEMGTEITRDKNPRSFWVNVWCGVAMIIIAISGITLSILEIIFPGI